MPISWRLHILLAEYNLKRAHAGEKILSVRGLAREAGIAHSTLVSIINGNTTRIDFETLDRLMDFFGTTDINDLLTRVPSDSGAE